MSSQNELIIKKERFILQRTPRTALKVLSQNWRQETPKRSASRSKLSVDKKIKKLGKPKQRPEQRLKKKQGLIRRPDPPHNTTQYIISANNACAETPNIYSHFDRFEYDFEHHAMAGSMMDLMRDRFSQMHEQSTQASTSQTEKTFESIEKADETPAEDRELFESPVGNEEESDPYNHYLKQAESGENLQGLIKQLVGVLSQKEEQISFLQSKLQQQGILNTEKR